MSSATNGLFVLKIAVQQQLIGSVVQIFSQSFICQLQLVLHLQLASALLRTV